MNNFNILIVEGNNREDSQFFIKVVGSSAADNLKNLILKIEPLSNVKIINPGRDDETTNETIKTHGPVPSCTYTLCHDDTKLPIGASWARP